MEFRIESTTHDDPVPAQTPDELRARLEKALAAWVEQTPQHTDDVAAGKFEAISEARQSGAKESELPKLIKKAHDDWKAHVKTSSTTLDPVHAEVVARCKAAIDGAVAQAAAWGMPVRVSIHGHVDPVSLDGMYQRPKVRVGTDIDLAKH